jgi:hypothetical protein
MRTPTRLELDKPVIAAIAGPAVAGGFEARPVVRPPRPGAMAQEIARFPQGCLRADRRSVYLHRSRRLSRAPGASPAAAADMEISPISD